MFTGTVFTGTMFTGTVFQTHASNASDVQVRVMCKCEFVAIGGAGVDGETGEELPCDQPAS
jgi:hypothetical protein